MPLRRLNINDHVGMTHAIHTFYLYYLAAILLHISFLHLIATAYLDLQDQHSDADSGFISLDPTSMAAICPIEMDSGELCASQSCNIRYYHGKRVQWVYCE